MRKLILLLLLIPASFFAQNSSTRTQTVSGKIIDINTKSPLDYATVVLKRNDSSDFIIGGVTNSRGNFSIDVQKGSYNITIEFVSYLTKNIAVSVNDKNLNIGTIELETDIESLSEIEITGKVNTVDFKQNKQVYNVTRDLSANGVSATQILSNIPSVSEDADGNLSIKGQGNVTVLINGKISSLSKADALKSLPAGSIDKIEVISNPGASHRASASGIINIILKKGKNEGLNSSITASAGYREVYGGLLTLNHKSKKVNFFTTLSYAHSAKTTLVNLENEYFTNQITTGFLKENNEIYKPSNDFMAIVGADFYLSDNSTLTASAKYDYINRDPLTNTSDTFYDASHTIISTNIGENNAEFKNDILEFTLDFKHDFKKEGQQLSSYIIYSYDNEYYFNDFTNSNPNYEDEVFIEENTLENTEVSVKYKHPIDETSGFEVGYLGTFGYTPYTLTEDNTEKKIIYTDYIQGLFIEYEKSWDSFYIGAGLRAEFTKLTTDYTNLNTKQKNNFNDLFPSIYMEYNLSDIKSLSLSYTRTIIRPGYYELRPYEQKISETTSYMGNINLQPIDVNATNFSYNYYGDKFTLISTLYWNYYENNIQPISFEINENGGDTPSKILTTYENIGNIDMYGLSLTANINATKWLNFTGGADVYQMVDEGIFQYTNSDNELIVKDFGNSNFSGNFNVLTKIKIPKVFDFQFNIINKLKSEAAFSEREAYTYVNAAINRELFNNNASISLSVDDVFNSRKLERTWLENTYTSNRIKREKYRTIVLSFTYRFNQDKHHKKVNFNKKQITQPL